MEQRESRFTGKTNTPARQTGQDLAPRYSGSMPDSVQQRESELIQTGYVISVSLDGEGQLARKVNEKIRRIRFAAIRTYDGLVADVIDLTDSIENDERQELTTGFAQMVLSDAPMSMLRTIHTVEGKISRVAETDLYGIVTAPKPTEPPRQKRLTWGERLKGKTTLGNE